MSAALNSPAAWEHTLPYRVLMKELRIRRPEVVPGDVDQLLDKVDLAAKKVKELREQDEPDLERYNAALNECAACEEPLKKILHEAQLNALCFSGGGIRSASFGLGVLWQLARQSWKAPGANQAGLLKQLDYVSTVSGGGYVGSWFTGWIKRHPQGLDGVMRELATAAPTSADPEPAPVRHLRDYTSYLAPRSGLLSPDLWTLAAIFVRNLLLNWAILVPAFAALLVLPLLDTYAFSWARNNLSAAWLLWVATLSAGFALLWTAVNLPGNYKKQPRRSWMTNFAWAGIPLLVSAWSLSACFLTARSHNVDFQGKFLLLWAMAGAAHAVLFARFAVAMWIRRKDGVSHDGVSHVVGNLLIQAFACFGASLFAAGILWILADKLGAHLVGNGDVRLFASVGIPLILTAFALTAVLLNGLSAQSDAEEDREWWSRAGAFVLMGVIGWPLAHLLVLYSREITEAASFNFIKAGGTVTIPALAGIIGALASWAGFSPATASAHGKVDFDKLSRTGKLLAKRDLLIPALGVLFFVLLAVALAQINDWLSRWLGDSPLPRSIPVNAIWMEFGCALGLALLLNIFVNVNTFSLHAMYRGRLVRSYLGASNNKRRPNPFTNFDALDNFPMQEAPHEKDAPLHIVNIALNVVATKKLAWQQRKAESFTASALDCGSYRVGYQPTAEYAGARGITLGTAMGISGAAASPNMGYHSSPILSLVMTFFNARLGWWLPNPGPHGYRWRRRTSPLFSLVPLLNEAMGKTTDENKWVYLSDGGHFENLALYEMVLRRCKRIIAVDGSADPSFNLDDLGNAVRKIFIDLGVPIEFDPPPAFNPLPETSPLHCYFASVGYSSVDGKEQEDGRLLYIKASLTGDEPADVTQYAKTHTDFPHESTANQFFNESQFESYVCLGSHIVRELVRQRFGDNQPSPIGLEDLFPAPKKPKSTGAGAR